MKKSNLAKIIALVFSCVLLACGIVGISVSAADGEASAEFEVVTLNYGADVKIAYAMNITGADVSDVALYLYKTADLSDTPVVSDFSGSYYNTSYPVYYSMGVAAKDLADYIYAVPVLKSSGEAIGELCRYSVAQYCYSVLSNSANSQDLLTLAEDLLTYGASAQTRLINIGNIADEALVTEYSYVYTTTDGAVLDGSYKSTLVAPDMTFVPSYTGTESVVEWEITTADGTVTKTPAEAAAGITVTASAKVEPVFFKPEGFDAGTTTSGNVTTEDKSSNTTITVGKDPTDSSNNVLKVVQENSSSSANSSTVVALANPNATGNCYTFEMKIYFTGMDSETSAQDLIQMYFTGETITNYAVGFGFKENANADKIYFSARNNVTGGTGNDSIYGFYGEGISVNANCWYTLRYEFYATGEPATTMTKIYIGEGDSEPTCVAEENLYRSTDITDIRNFRILWQKYATEYTIYLDDVSLVKSDKEFVTSEPPVTAEGFDAEDTSVYVDTNYRVYTTYTEGGNTPSIATDPADTSNNVLKVQKAAQGASAYTHIKFFEKLADSNCYTYSSKIYFGTPTNTGDNIVVLKFLSSSSTSIAQVGFAITYGATDTIYIKQSAKLQDFGGSDITLSPNSWYELKLELYDLGDGTGVMKVFLASAGQEPICLTELTVSDMTAPESFRLDWEKNKTASVIYVDDIMLTGGVKEFISDTSAE